MSASYTLYHASSMSSTYVIALLELFNIPHTLKTIDVDFLPNGMEFGTKADEELFAELKNVNPLAQFPTLVVNDGGGQFVLTEMAAIAFYFHDKYAVGTPWSTKSLTSAQLALYYRLMVLIPANIYPPITMIDFPSRFVEVPPSTQVPATLVHVWVRDKAEQNRKMAFSLFESLLQPSSDAPFALGTSEPTLLDVFMSTFAHYSPRPRPEWLQENCPRIYACCRKTLQHPVLRKVFVLQDFECSLVSSE